MSDVGVLYLAAVLCTAVAITFLLRAAPFLLTDLVQRSPLLTDLARWMPLGAVIVLAIYGLGRIDLGAPEHGVPAASGIAVVVLLHLRWSNPALTLAGGTAVFLAVQALMA